ncbi:TRAP transporter small permease [Afifella sp. IM 167]|uniref:TRAP transporter small permease n=1 Tax=Afifella sp. IM 167 TaxID=2033586 RepID=UPI001CCF4DF4|nr:TRAP transporter small permease [Afifella sp. IM 167]MBZ8135165.1 C4-dicarboxylate ABC transporter permease [Afifella sp. IM 167]
MKAARLLEQAELWISNLCLAGLVVVLALQVFFRYGLELGLSWSEEVSRFLFIWFVYISASLAARAGTHVRVTAFVEMLPRAASRATKVAADLVWIAFNAIVVVSGVLLFWRMLQYPVYSTSLLLPLSWIYLVIPLAHLMMIARILQRLGRWDDPASSAVAARSGEG